MRRIASHYSAGFHYLCCIATTVSCIAREGRDSLLASAVGRDWKGKLSPVLYLIAIPLAFVNSWIASGLYVFFTLLWLIPDPRIERELEKREH